MQDIGKNYNIRTFYTVSVNACCITEVLLWLIHFFKSEDLLDSGSATALDSTFIFQHYVLTNAVGVSALSMYIIFLEPKIEIWNLRNAGNITLMQNSFYKCITVVLPMFRIFFPSKN